MMRFLVMLVVLILFFLVMPFSTYAVSRSYEPAVFSTNKPRFPQIYANEGGTFKWNGITLTVAPGTVPYDTYLTFGVTEKVNPIRISKYWQVSDIYQVWLRSHYNGAKVLNPRKSSIIVIPYSDSDLEVGSFFRFPESSLKMVCSPNEGDTWHMERSTYVDTSAKTVSALTRVGGGCMLMAGFVRSTQYVNFRHIF